MASGFPHFVIHRMDAWYPKPVLSAIAIAITLAALGPYLLASIRGAVRPHVFSWVIWGLTTLIVFAATVSQGGGAGAWPIALSAALSLAVAMVAWWRRSDVSTTRSDRLFLGAALITVPTWYLTSDPLYAVIVLTAVDLLGFGPTMRRAFIAPESESALFFLAFALRNAAVLGALEHYSLTTMLFPAAIGLACMGVVVVLLMRRADRIRRGL